MPETTEALFPNIRDALNLLKSPLFQDFMALVAAFQTEGKDDDKAAFKQLLIDAGQDNLAPYVDVLYDVVLAIIAAAKGLTKEEESLDPQILTSGIFGGGKTRFFPCVRIRAARIYAREQDITIGAALKKINDKITDAQIEGFAAQTGVTVGAIGDGHILQFIVDHGPEIMAIIRLILMALMAA